MGRQPESDGQPASPLPDPWLDAAQIAARWRQADSRIVLALGAQWCDACRQNLPLFQALASTNPRAQWLWLDLEAHHEFVAECYPPDLPWLMLYQEQDLLWQGSWRSLGAQAQQHLQTFAQGQLPALPLDAEVDATALVARFLDQNWAV